MSDQLESNFKPIRKVVIFPLNKVSQVSETTKAKVVWKIREQLIKKTSVSVASSEFLQRRKVDQHRWNLDISDAIILGQYLGADALITLRYGALEKKLFLQIYDGRTGFFIWQGQVGAHPSFLPHQQLEEMASILTKQFLKSVPYDGFLKPKSKVSQKMVDFKNFNHYVYLKAMAGTPFEANQKVTLFKIKSTYKDNLFSKGGHVGEAIVEAYVDKVSSNFQVARAYLIEPSSQQIEQLQDGAFASIHQSDFKKEMSSSRLDLALHNLEKDKIDKGSPSKSKTQINSVLSTILQALVVVIFLL